VVSLKIPFLFQIHIKPSLISEFRVSNLCTSKSPSWDDKFILLIYVDPLKIIFEQGVFSLLLIFQV
jgi:hypothetical protein